MSAVSLDRLRAGEALPEKAVLLADRVVTCDPKRATPIDPLGVIEDAAVLVIGGRVAAVGTRPEILSAAGDAKTIHVGSLMTPGLVDAHTHAAYVGSRHEEYALRMSGAGYEEIAKAGGGILSSMRSTRNASRGEIREALIRRLARMAALGVTTVEVKSGYGLDLTNEQKQLEAIRDVGRERNAPNVVSTYLALHALPPEAGGDRDAYAKRVAEHDIDAIADAGLARFVDAYVDRNAFSVDQARPALLRARARGLGVRIHIGQFEDVGGADLAADVGASSVDHLEHVDERGARRLAAARVHAVLLPVASFTLEQAPPPVAVLRDAAVEIVVASDANPGTAPTESLPLAMAFGVRAYGLTVAEAILGATREAARSLGLDDVGFIAAGSRADIVAWDLPHESALVQPHGTSRASLVLRDGVVLASTAS